MTDAPKPPVNPITLERDRIVHLMHDPFVVGLCKRILELEREVMDLRDRIEDDYR